MPDRERNPLADVPPAQFVAARDALVRELRGQGKAADARTVAGLRRPSVPVWVVNQLARRHPAEVGALIEVTRRLAAAQAGGGALREAMEEQRKLLAGLLAEAEKVLAEAGVRNAPELERRVRATLQGAAAREPQKLRDGELEEELEPLGFGELSGTEDAGRAPAARPRAAESIPVGTEGRATAAGQRRTEAKPERERDRPREKRAPDERGLAAARERATDEQAAQRERLARERVAAERERAAQEQVAAERERAAQERKAAARAERERAARRAEARRTADAAKKNAERLARRAADAERAAARASEAAAKANETAAAARAAATEAARIADEARAAAEKL
jgi:hypothetical protein